MYVIKEKIGLGVGFKISFILSSNWFDGLSMVSLLKIIIQCSDFYKTV